MNKWDRRFLTLAQLVATWSKDPSTQVGAVIADPLNRVVSLGFNGFPRGLPDDTDLLQDRDAKYRVIIHAEENALAFARTDVAGCTLYVAPLSPCAPCASRIIQAGIRRVVAPRPRQENADAILRWNQDTQFAFRMFMKAGVEVELLEL